MRTQLSPLLPNGPQLATGATAATTADVAVDEAAATAGVMAVAGIKPTGSKTATEKPAATTDATGERISTSETGTAPNQTADNGLAKQKTVSGVSNAARAFADRMRDVGATASQGGDTSATQTAALPTGHTAQTTAATAATHTTATASAVKPDDIGATIVRHVKAGETSFSVRLDPAELGKVDVKVAFSADGSAKAHLVVERRDTFEALSRDQRHIEQTLRDAGFEVKDGSVSLSMRQDGNQQDRSAMFARQDQQQQQQQQQQQARQAQAENLARTRTEDDAKAAILPGAYRPQGDSRIDIRV